MSICIVCYLCGYGKSFLELRSNLKRGENVFDDITHRFRSLLDIRKVVTTFQTMLCVIMLNVELIDFKNSLYKRQAVI